MSNFRNDYVVKNQYSRPGKLLNDVKKLVIHYTANPGASADAHKRFFDGADGGGGRYASAHIFVDTKEAICIIPLNEMAYHANDTYQRSKLGTAFRGVPEIAPNANQHSIGVEMCVEKDGTISPITIDRTAKVMAELCQKFKLNENDIVRHYDVTHKPCPKPFVDHPIEFADFKKRVHDILNPVVVKKPPAYPGYLSKKGSRGTTVVLIQKALGVISDGIFGEITKKAVGDFQRKNNLKVDYIVGKNTWSKLFQ